jgi:hypothetical protein
MALDVVGKIVQILDLQTGTSARGDWKKQEFILETEEQYPRKICISLWGDRVNDIVGIQLGRELVTVSVALESREFNGRWYTDARAWKIQRGIVAGEPVAAAPAAPIASYVPAAAAASAPVVTPTGGEGDFANTGGEDSFDDLPF